MPLKIYQDKEFDHTHEREFFEQLIEKLKSEFSDESNQYALLGNFKCSGSEIDAMFIKSDAAIVLDFKNYSGELTFKDNGPWKINGVEVKGGNTANPFEQLKNYRSTFSNYLINIINGIDKKELRKLVKSVVVFHGDVKLREFPKDFFNKNPWFKLTDTNKIVTDILNITTPAIRFSDEEILNIPGKLGLSERRERRALRSSNTTEIELKELFKTIVQLKSKQEAMELLTDGFKRILKDHDDFIAYFYDNYTPPHILAENKKNITKFKRETDQFKLKITEDIKILGDKTLNLYTNVAEQIINATGTANIKIHDQTVKDLDRTLRGFKKLPQLKDEPEGTFNFDILSGIQLLYRTRKIFTYSSFDYVANELRKIPGALPALHGIYMVLYRLFSSDILVHYSDQMGPEKKRKEYRFARGLSAKWYDNLFSHSRLFKLESKGEPIARQVKLSRLQEFEIIYKLPLPVELNNLLAELLDDLRKNSGSPEIFDALFDLFNFKSITSGQLNYDELLLAELNTQVIMSTMVDEQLLVTDRMEHLAYSLIYEPFQILLLEGIADWRMGIIKSEEVNNVSYHCLPDQIKGKIDELLANYRYSKNYSSGLNKEFHYQNRLRVRIDENKNWGTFVLPELKQDESEVISYTEAIHQHILRPYRKLPHYIGDTIYIQLLKEFRNDKKIKAVIPNLKKEAIVSRNIEVIDAEDTEKSQIVGYEDVKKDILRIVNNVLYPERLKKYDKQPPGGILFFGPPGCGKTYWANWIAEQVSFQFEEIKRSDFASSYVSGELQGLKEIFDRVKKSKKQTVLFFDEFDDIGKKRNGGSVGAEENSKLVNNMLQEIDKLQNMGHLIIAATNFADNLDSALIRPGRFDTKIPIFPPLPQERSAILRFLLVEKNPTSELAKIFTENDLDDEDYFDELGNKMILFSNSHVVLTAEKIKDGLIECEYDGVDIDKGYLKELVDSAIEDSLAEISKSLLTDYHNFLKDLSAVKTRKFSNRRQSLETELGNFRDGTGKGIGFKI